MFLLTLEYIVRIWCYDLHLSKRHQKGGVLNLWRVYSKNSVDLFQYNRKLSESVKVFVQFNQSICICIAYFLKKKRLIESDWHSIHIFVVFSMLTWNVLLAVGLIYFFFEKFIESPLFRRKRAIIRNDAFFASDQSSNHFVFELIASNGRAVLNKLCDNLN